jgi:hypothetical protein
LDYQGNTRKEREEKEKKKDKPEKVVVQVVSGEVIQKPKTIGRRFKDIFFTGDAKQALMSATSDILFPALKSLIVDMTSKTVERVVFGETRRRVPTPYQRTDYNTRYYVNSPLTQRPIDPRVSANLPDQPRIRQNRHEMNDVVLSTREDAELVLERLNDILETYQVVALADLYVLLGLETSHIDNKWGWTYLNNAQVRQIRQGYLLELPLLEEI